MALEEGRARPPRRSRPPVLSLLRRLAFAVGLLLLVALTTWIGRDGYVDDVDGTISFLDGVYYASVTVTTTGYGDITPVTPTARLATTLIVTPVRVTFLLLLVGTTVELLTERWREEHRRQRWRQRVRDHYVICGYGVKGRSAARALSEDGVDPERIVVVESSQTPANEANIAGYTVVVGDATRTTVLSEAKVERARAVIVAANRDDSAVLITLTARELAPEATIVAAVREAENAHLLSQSGADAAITSSEASGRLLGLTSRNPRVGAVVTDLLHTSEGLSLSEREVTEEEVGRPLANVTDQIPVAVMRDGRLLRYDAPELEELRAGDRLIGLPENGAAQ